MNITALQSAFIAVANTPTYWTYKEADADEWQDAEFKARGVMEIYIHEEMESSNMGELYAVLGTYQKDFILGQFVFDQDGNKNFIKEVNYHADLDE